MKIDEIMTTNIVCVDLYERLSVVRQLFIKHKFHHLMVTNEKGELIGVLSERDYLKSTNSNLELPTANSKDLAMLNKRVHQVISKELIAIKQFTSFNKAIKIFHDTGVSCLPIINAQNKPVGVITWRDIISWLYGKVNVVKV